MPQFDTGNPLDTLLGINQAGAPIKVLIADDDRFTRVSIERTLQKEGFDVVLAKNGRQAVELMSDQIGAAILDLNMPEMDGMASLRYIRQKFKDFSPIVLTASDDISNAVEAMKYGAFDYLTKPFDLKKLAALVKIAFNTYEQAKRLRQVETELAKARENEIETASKIQRTLLLGQPPQDLQGVQVADLSIASQKVDGDFYDFFKRSNQCFDLLVGDVMGKGIPAALLGAAVKSHFLRVLNELDWTDDGNALPSEPEKIVAGVHAGMIDQMEELETFVTLCYARFDLLNRLLTFVDCGHTRTIHFHYDSNSVTLLQGKNMPLGFPEIEPFTQSAVPLMPGDIFFFYSDGLTEAKNHDADLFGEERLIDLVHKTSGSPPWDLISIVHKKIVAFSHSESFDDDFTCVVVKIDQNFSALSLLREANFEIRSDPKETARVRAFVRDFCTRGTKSNLDEARLCGIELAASETINNIIEHAYRGQTGKPIQISAQLSEGKMVLRFYDWGEGFDPKSVPPPNFDGSQEGGFGVYIISQSVDEVVYSRNDRGRNCTCLTIILNGGK